LPRNIRDREFDKFCELAVKKTAVRVCGDALADPIPITFAAGTVVSTYAEISSLAASTLTTIVSYTVPALKKFQMDQVQVSGCNVATYTVLEDATTISKKRSYWADFNQEFDFFGLEFAAGKVITVKVIHERTGPGDFEARITGALLNA
jgi:hypothetical protein